MTYCPECGSEVAPENTFCAYCGMALTPVVPIVEEKPAPVETSSKQEAAENPTVPTQENETPYYAPAEHSSSSKEEELPETLQAYSGSLPDFGWAAPEIKPEAKKAEQTADSIPMKTESVELSPFDFNNPSPKEDFSQNVPEVSEKPLTEPESFQAEPFSTPKIEELDSAKSDWSEQAYKDQPFSIPPQETKSPEIAAGKQEDFSNLSPEPDFQSTIPYTPSDFVKQELVSSKAGNVPDEVKENKFEPEAPKPINDPSKQNQPAIAKPEIPVGSAQHDSLEPKQISVQIYNPDEKPEDAVSKNEESLYDSQTLLKHVPKQTPSVSAPPPQKEARSYTSPNMGNDDTDGRSKAKLKPLDEGTILNGRYEIVRKIGGGGMGAVYLASDRNLGGVLRAVKEMVQSYIEDAQQEKAVNDFKRESLLLTSLEHPAIPTIFDYFYDEKEGRFYLVMKYISGGDLAGRMRATAEGKLDEATVTEWGMQIADVLDYLHNRQPPIIYRDLKPSNVMIDGNTGRVMLIDFGIARWVNKEEKGVTAVGTMGYAPPELFSGNVEPRSDIYSLGSTMFHLLTGADPQSNPLLIFDFHKNPRPRQINSTLSDQMEQILMRMVEYSADRRFGSAGELRDALAKHLENLRRNSVTYGAGEAVKAVPAANELVFCGFCGQKIVATDVFCPFCGAQQPLAGKGAGAGQPVYVAPKLTAKLMVISTNELNAPMFNLEKDSNLVGRRDPMSNIFPEVDLSKFDPQTKISRKHARIWRESDKYMVEDLGSSNGTILINNANDSLRLMKNQPHVLTHGDKLRVGDTTLHFVLS
jgi:eukaryotic-like serine/threonine-protein kinase